MPIDVMNYDPRSGEIVYRLAPSKEEEGEWFSLVVEPIERQKVRLLLYKGERVDLESGEVAESDPLLLTDKSARGTFYRTVKKLFGKKDWIEMALTALSRTHSKHISEQVKRLSKDREGFVALTKESPIIYFTPYGYRQEGDSSGSMFALTNFTARILEDLKIVEGGDYSRRIFKIRATREGRKTTFEIPAGQFNSLSWVPTQVGALAHYDAKKNLVTKAIRLESRRFIKEVTAFGHTGWVKLEDGRLVYLHSEGAIVPPGTAPFAGRVFLEGKLARRTFPKGDDPSLIKEAVRKSFTLWDLYPHQVSIPVMAAAYRAALGPVDFSIYLVGPTGIGKTSYSDMVMRFYGESLGPKDRTNFESTKFSVERQAYRLKDQLVVLDDYLGTARHAEIMRFIVRVAGNESGRGRMNEGDKPPRGLLLITGEVQPPDRSLNARLFTLQFTDEPGWKDKAKFQKAKAISRDGSLPLAMRAFIESLAPRYGDLKENLEVRKEDYGEQVAGLANHSRTPGIYGDLMVGVEEWLNFAWDIGVISDEEQQAYLDTAESAVSAAVIAQAPLVGSMEETDEIEIVRFALKEAIKTGRAYVSGPTAAEAVMGQAQEGSQHLGWKIDPKGLYLIPDAVFEVTTEMGIELSITVPETKESLHAKLRQSSYLLATNWNKRRKSTATRRVIEGKERTVLRLQPKFLTE